MTKEIMLAVHREIDSNLVLNKGIVFEVHVFSRHTNTGLLTQNEEYLIYNRYCKLGYDCSFFEMEDLVKRNDSLFIKVMEKLRLTTQYVSQEFINDFIKESKMYRVFIIAAK